MSNQYISVIYVVGSIIFSTWMFNHLDPWVGIGAFLLTGAVAMALYNKYFKTEK